MKNHLPLLSAILLIVYIHFALGCVYYKVTRSDTIAPVVTSIQQNSRYFIVHQGSYAWHLTSVGLDNEKELLTGRLEGLPDDHMYYLTTKPVGPNQYKSKPVPYANPTYEVHFYISEYMENLDGSITIPLGSIEKVEIYDSDTGANTTSAIISTLGAIAGVIVIVGIIVALTKSSCPFVYVQEGNAFHFMGEMYGGAVYSSLERHDYMPLPGFGPTADGCKVKISNELKERQYTNLAELIVVEHPAASSVLLDKSGRVHTLRDPRAPRQAYSGQQSDYSLVVGSKDNNAYMFNEENPGHKEWSSMELIFDKPQDGDTGKLVISAKNSYWLDYVFGKFNEEFGTYYNTFSAAQKDVPAERINDWSLEQGIPLSVYVENADGWQFVDYFHVTGPLAAREMIMPVDISRARGDQVKIKLECGFMFWELDYAAMEFAGNIAVNTSAVAPLTAIDQDGRDVSSFLTAVDSSYLYQPEAGNAVVITYPVAPPSGENLQTIFLHSKGYYEYIRDYQNAPDVFKLLSFRSKAAFARFSKQQYNAFIRKPQFFEETITSHDRD